MKKLLTVRTTILSLGILSLGALASAQDIGLSISTLNNPFFIELQEGAQQAAEEAGLELTVLDAQNQVGTQVGDIEDLITQGVEVILINPTDSAAVVPAIRRANEAGIPVITVDRGAEGGDIAYHIASDNVAGGRMAAEYICEQLGGEGNVVELQGIPGTSAARDRGQGFNEYMQENCPGVEIVARQPAGFDRAEGLSVMENILVAEPEIDAVFAHNDEMALGALQAIEGSGRDIMVVGFDATDDAVQAVEECRLAATIAQQPAEIGELAVEQAAAIIQTGEVPQETQFIPVELQLVTNESCE